MRADRDAVMVAADRRRDPPPRRRAAFLRPFALNGRWGAAALLLAATLIRLPLLLAPGYDVRDYKVWARIVSEVGIGGAYGATYPPPIPWFNYPPLYLYNLRLTGLAYRWLRPTGTWDEQFLAALLKVGPIAAEVALGWLLYRFVRRHGTRGLALAAAAAYLFNPPIVWDTAYWGGIDAFHALFLTAALFAATERGPLLAWPLATLAIGGKLLALPGALATVPPALRRAPPGRLALAAGAALAVGLLLAAPVLMSGQFGLMVTAQFRNLGNSAVASANAHNLWWLVTWGDGWRADTTPLLPGLDYRRTGLLLFAACAAGALYALWRAPGGASAVCDTGAFLCYAFFIVTTEVHENWSFGLFAPLVATAALRGGAYRSLYAALSLTFLANLALHDPPLRDLLGPGFDGTARTLGLLNAAAQCALFLWWGGLLAWRYRGRAGGRGG